MRADFPQEHHRVEQSTCWQVRAKNGGCLDGESLKAVYKILLLILESLCTHVGGVHLMQSGRAGYVVAGTVNARFQEGLKRSDAQGGGEVTSSQLIRS